MLLYYLSLLPVVEDDPLSYSLISPSTSFGIVDLNDPSNTDSDIFSDVNDDE